MEDPTCTYVTGLLVKGVTDLTDSMAEVPRTDLVASYELGVLGHVLVVIITVLKEFKLV